MPKRKVKKGKIPKGLLEVATILDDPEAYFLQKHVPSDPGTILVRKTLDEVRERVDDARKRLVRWLEAWISSERNTVEFLRRQSDVARILNKYISDGGFVMLWAANGPSKPVFVLPPGAEVTVSGLAVRLFLAVVMHDECHRCSRCDRCKRIYIALTKRGNKRFCTRICGNNMPRRRPAKEAKEAMRLKKVARALERLPPRERPDWKRWASAQTGVSLNQITRWFKTGELLVAFE
jgi:hypothetical protein